MTLYHKDLGLPKSARSLQFAGFLTYSQHARDAAKTDRYGQVDLPTIFDSRNASLIEAGYDGEKVVKTVYRQQYDRQHDLCIVLDPRTMRVITVWLNRLDDHHRTLQEDKYAQL